MTEEKLSELTVELNNLVRFEYALLPKPWLDDIIQEVSAIPNYKRANWVKDQDDFSLNSPHSHDYYFKVSSFELEKMESSLPKDLARHALSKLYDFVHWISDGFKHKIALGYLNGDTFPKIYLSSPHQVGPGVYRFKIQFDYGGVIIKEGKDKK